MTKILAVDPSSTEVGLYDGEHAYTILANKKKPRCERLCFIMQQFSEFMLANGPYDFVVYEEQFVRGGAATKALFGSVGVIEAMSIHRGAGVMPVPQGTLGEWARKEQPGKFKNQKALYEAVALHHDPRHGVGYASEHEYDAACIYYFIQNRGVIN